MSPQVDMFLSDPPLTEETEAAYAADLEEDGYVHTYTRLWSWHPGLWDSFQALRDGLTNTSTLTDRDWAVMVTSTASELSDSYCSLAWGAIFAELSDAETAAQVLADQPAPALSEREVALGRWARQLVRDPNATTAQDVERLRAVGLGDREIFEATAWIAFRLAVSTVNDALGAVPDVQLADKTPVQVRDAVTYGRRPTVA